MFKVATLILAGAAIAHADPTPQERAKALLDLQAKAISDRDQAALDATFVPEVIALVPDPRAIVTRSDIDSIRRTSPHESLNWAKFTKIVAGGDANAVWISAELEVDGAGGEPGFGTHRFRRHLRVTELATADRGWKVVAAAFTEPSSPREVGDPAPEMPAKADKPTALADLLAAPAKLEAALGKDPSVTVFGTDEGEKAYGGAAAHAIVESWKKLAFTRVGDVHEGRGKGWAYAMSYVDWLRKPTDKKPLRMCALAIAQLDAKGAPTIVAVQYVGMN